MHLPWQKLSSSHWEVERADGSSNGMLCCPHCTKKFRDERAQKNHVKCVHTNGGDTSSLIEDDGDADGEEKEEQFVCKHCQLSNDSGENISHDNRGRVFKTAQGLADHIRAKHSAVHTDIKPEWARANSTASREDSINGAPDHDNFEDEPPPPETSESSIGSCDICGLVYHSEDDRARHMVGFVPQPVVDGSDTSKTANTIQCAYCNKSFKDTRAVRQHENFCSLRGHKQTLER